MKQKNNVTALRRLVVLRQVADEHNVVDNQRVLVVFHDLHLGTG